MFVLNLHEKLVWRRQADLLGELMNPRVSYLNYSFVQSSQQKFGIQSTLQLRGLLSPIYPCGIRFESYSHGTDLKFCLIVEQTKREILCFSNFENYFQFRSYIRFTSEIR